MKFAPVLTESLEENIKTLQNEIKELSAKVEQLEKEVDDKLQSIEKLSSENEILGDVSKLAETKLFHQEVIIASKSYLVLMFKIIFTIRKPLRF